MQGKRVETPTLWSKPPGFLLLPRLSWKCDLKGIRCFIIIKLWTLKWQVSIVYSFFVLKAVFILTAKKQKYGYILIYKALRFKPTAHQA